MIATRSDEIREQVAQIPWSIFISKNYQNDISKWPDIKDDDQKFQVVRRYSVSKTSVSFTYQLKLLCDVLSWFVWLKYQLMRRYDVSNWSVLSMYQWDVSKVFQNSPMAYQLWWHNDVSAWFGAFKLVTLVNFISQFLLRTMQ